MVATVERADILSPIKGTGQASANDADGIDPREFRRTMGAFATGVTVITTRDGDEAHGMTANSVTSVSLDPPLVLVCIDNRAHMRASITGSGRFAVNILGEGQKRLSGHFAGRKSPDLEVAFADVDGVPALPGSLASLVCTVDRVVDAGDHIVVFGRVDKLVAPHGDERPLIYYGGAYRELVAGSDSNNFLVHDLPYVF